MKPQWKSTAGGAPLPALERLDVPVITDIAAAIKPVPRAVEPARERRGVIKDADQAALRTGLTVRQAEALATLEHFGWTLRFVRRPMFRAPIPIVFAPDGGRFVVLEEDGEINENPGVCRSEGCKS